MSQSGAGVSEECVKVYNELKLGKALKYIIYKLSDDNKNIVIEEASKSKNYESFRQKLIHATSKGKNGAEVIGPRYAVYDFEYQLASGDGIRNKLTFIAWSPDDAPIGPKMVYASSKDALKRSLTGLGAEVQANDADDIEWETIIKVISKGLASLEPPSDEQAPEPTTDEV